MLDIIFKDDASFWLQLRFVALHGALLGFGLGFGLGLVVMLIRGLGLLEKL